MSAFKVMLSKHTNWENAEFNVSSAWGNGNDGSDIWGWTGGASLEVSDVLTENGQSYIVVTAENPNPGPDEQLAFITRYILGDGKTKGTLCTMLND